MNVHGKKNVFTEHICEMFADNVFLPKKAILQSLSTQC